MKTMIHSTQNQTAAGDLVLTHADWQVVVSPDGMIKHLDMAFGGSRVNIPWRGDGAPIPGVELKCIGSDKLEFVGRLGQQVYSLAYADDNGRLAMNVSITNESDTPFPVSPHARFRLGIDHEMSDPETYFNVFFPTLLRCEKSHFWGYFQAPNGQVLVIASPDPVASWNLDYIECGHRIATTNLDLMHVLPLPERHPRTLTKLDAGETKSWRIYLQPVANLNEVMTAVAEISQAPAIALDRTVAASGEWIELQIHSADNQAIQLTVTDAEGGTVLIPAPENKNKGLAYQFPAPDTIGPLVIRATAGRQQSEAQVYVRKPWGWYLQQASKEAMRNQQKPLQHREGWMGFFSAYWSQVYFPDAEQLDEIEAKFELFFAQMIDPATGYFYANKPTWSTRPQNGSWMLGLLVARYAATRKTEHLEQSANWADLFIDKFQKSDGAFVGYTSLTLGAKFLQELAWFERQLAKDDPCWHKRMQRHVTAMEKAAENILAVKDLGDTEGEATYEDTQAGSAWSLLALHALTTNDPQKRQTYLTTSLEVRKRHECLTQALIPDGRMRGGTLRWWESQYDVLTSPNMMNSPHAWTMRSQFGAFYLYLLTGEEYYLNLVTNAMGACIQAIDHETGLLRWAFVPDPYINAKLFVPDETRTGQGKVIPTIVGEQWLPMISDWWRVPEDEIGALLGHNQKNGEHTFSQGWSCDNDVHEHFRVLTEQFLPNAFVLEREDGSFRCWNCRMEYHGSTLVIIPFEKAVMRVHLNLRRAQDVEIDFPSGRHAQKVACGMHWVGSPSQHAIAPDIYLT